MAIVKAILLAHVKNYGKAGHVVEMRRGFFRYLERLQKVRYATKNAIKELENEQEFLRIKDEEQYQQSKKLAEKLNGYTLKIMKETSDSGALYGSVSARDIAKELENQFNISLDYHHVCLEHAIKDLGSYPVQIELYHDVVTAIQVIVEPIKTTVTH